ncbi:MAG: hypothetical protein EPO32_07395 [Anaerolineae bacterium]|nr:MAG: hypothetical protein EPO32_07395 [Anaerolineae bacterium]
MDSAGAFAGLSMGAGIILFFATGSFDYTIDLPDIWILESYPIPISLATVLLMATSLSYFSYPYISKAAAAMPEEL